MEFKVSHKHPKMVELKLFGTWYSPYSCRVIWALKLIGIEYEHIEEDPTNKRPSLLRYNPIYKRVPVLVHNGKPIVESMLILEYIGDMTGNPLLPKDPYERSVVRFWDKFADEKNTNIGALFRTAGDAHAKAVKTSEFLQTVEDYGLGDMKIFGGDVIRLADLAFAGVAHWLGVLEDLVGVKLLDAQTFPRLHAWTENFKGAPVIKENLPVPAELLVYFKRQREMIQASQPN